MNAPIYQYPNTAETNGDVLYAAMGSFWIQTFRDRGVVRSLSISAAEEIFQNYYDLLDTIASYSADDIPAFNRTKWYPVVIKKSELNNSPPRFGDGSVFGEQPAGSIYEGETFTFGEPKGATEYYSFVLKDPVKRLGCITDRILSPAKILAAENDFRLVDGTVYFKNNPFSISTAAIFNLIGEDGVPETFTDRNNIVQNDQVVVLWAYQVDTDVSNQYFSLGYLFGLRLEEGERFKAVLSAATKLFSKGPAINKITSVIAAFMGIKPVVEAVETVQAIQTTSELKIVVTDKTVYRFDAFYTLRSTVIVGATFYSGDILVNELEFCDYIVSRNWWNTKLVPKASIDDIEATANTVKTPKIYFPPYMFAAAPEFQLGFKNEPDLITRDADGYMRFPVEGTVADVAKFNDYLNRDEATVEAMGAALGLEPGEALVVNPLQLIFEIFLKTGTALIRLNLKDLRSFEEFSRFFNIIKNCLPKHVYLLFFIDVPLSVQVYDNLDGGTSITIDGDEVTDANPDGSNVNGFMDEGVANYNEDPQLRLFSLSAGIGPTQLTAAANSGVFPTVDLLVRDGTLLNTIPEGKTTRQVNNLLLLGF